MWHDLLGVCEMTTNNKPVFSPSAWQKYILLRDMGGTEISAMAICFDPDEPLKINDLYVPEQTCSSAYTEFDDDALSELYEMYGPQIDPDDDTKLTGLHPYQFSRIWLHTHPGQSAKPSGTDHTTFKERFGPPDWAVMFILARGGQTHCELKVRSESGLVNAHVRHDSSEWVDWSMPCVPVNHDELKEIYKKKVKTSHAAVSYGGAWNGGHSYTTRGGKPGYYANGKWTEYGTQGKSNQTGTKKIEVNQRNQREPLDFGDLEWRYKREDHFMKQYLQDVYVDIKTWGNAADVMKRDDFEEVWAPDDQDFAMWMDQKWLMGRDCKIEFIDESEDGEETIWECSAQEAQMLVQKKVIEDTDFGEFFGADKKDDEDDEELDFSFPGLHMWQ